MKGYNTEADEKIKSQNVNMMLMKEDLNYLAELIKMGRGGRLIEQIEDRMKDAIDKGPIADIREQYALRASVEKDVMKL